MLRLMGRRAAAMGAQSHAATVSASVTATAAGRGVGLGRMAAPAWAVAGGPLRSLAVSVDKRAAPPLHPLLEAAMYNAGGEVKEKKQRLRRAEDLLSATAHSRNLKGSPYKMNMLCHQIRGKHVLQAQVQLQFSNKQHYPPKVIHCLNKAVALAEINHGLLPPQLRVAEVIVNKAKFGKKLRYHAKGRAGVMRMKYCNISIRLEEIDWDFEIASAYDTDTRDATLRLKQATESGNALQMQAPDFRAVFAPKKRRKYLEADAAAALEEEHARVAALEAESAKPAEEVEA
uniref:50S ribosomal protein L22, chloroplastic n=1 Tax=Phaeomonas parva TaxID=124430 RepID=A0A7S1U7J4_9STRA|mmetsp:Transcript_35324/g.111177  ORF Transcript_35324/g.111177 Transcript_35324/m.111177 type:complete len:288 (+) Transcript_35324:126-989(+)